MLDTKNKKYFLLEIEEIGDDWENNYHYIFNSYEEAKSYEKEYDNDNKTKDGEYIPNIRAIYYDIVEIDDETAREILTVNKYLEVNNLKWEDLVDAYNNRRKE